MIIRLAAALMLMSSVFAFGETREKQQDTATALQPTGSPAGKLGKPQ